MVENLILTDFQAVLLGICLIISGIFLFYIFSESFIARILGYIFLAAGGSIIGLHFNLKQNLLKDYSKLEKNIEDTIPGFEIFGGITEKKYDQLTNGDLKSTDLLVKSTQDQKVYEMIIDCNDYKIYCEYEDGKYFCINEN